MRSISWRRLICKCMKDFSEVNSKPDHVRCNYCMEEMLVDYDVDVCPVCGKSGYLIDIEQEVDL